MRFIGVLKDVMRTRGMALGAVVVLALALAAAPASGGKTRTLTDSTGATPHLARGGEFVAKAREASGRQIRVTISLRLTVRAATQVAVYVYPCRDTSCDNRASARVRLTPGRRSVRFSGLVPAVRQTANGRETRKACIYTHALDLGGEGDRTRQIKLRRRGAGAVLCLDLSK